MTTNGQTSFRDEAEAALLELRSSLEALLEEAGAGGQRPQDVAHLIEIDKNLAWKTCRLIEAPGPLDGLQHLPGRQGLQILLRAAEKHGAKRTTTGRCERALAAVESIIEEHAGDRATMEALVSGYSREVLQKSSERHLKQMYQGSSFVWGIQAESRLICRLIQPSENPALLDIANVGGLGNLRRLRDGASCAIGRWAYREQSEPGVYREVIDVQPIDDSVSREGAPFLPEFCSQPLPSTEIVRYQNGILEHRVSGGTVGAHSIMTIMTGSLVKGLHERFQTERDPFGTFLTPVELPIQKLYFDVMIHDDLLPWMRPMARMRSLLYPSDVRPGEVPGGEELPLGLTVQEMGRGPGGGTTRELPYYERMMHRVMSHLGWRASQFHLFRLEVGYPPVGTALVMQMPLAPKP